MNTKAHLQLSLKIAVAAKRFAKLHNLPEYETRAAMQEGAMITLGHITEDIQVAKIAKQITKSNVIQFPRSK